MKRFLITILVLIPHFTFAQGLKEIFLALAPDHFGITRVQADSMIINFVAGSTNPGVGLQKHYFMAYDQRNGYLSFTGAYEGSTALTYWNISTGSKLIGISSISCGPACDSHLDFLLLKDGQYKSIPVDKILPELSFADFMDTTRMLQDKIDIQKEKVAFGTYDLLYRLPSKGKNIVVKSQYQEFAMDDKLKTYSLGSRIELTWQDGKFIKGKHLGE